MMAVMKSIAALGIALIVYLIGCKGGLVMDNPIVEENSVYEDSVSEVLRSSTILLIRLDEIVYGAWAQEAQGDLMTRQVNMQVTIERILKGDVLQKANEPFGMEVQQRGTGGFRVMDYYGLWSDIDLVEGLRLVAFCSGESEDVKELLTDDNCEQLLDADIALADTEASVELEAQSLSSEELLARAAVLSSQRTDIFGRYVWGKVRNDAMNSLDIFEATVRILEDPDTTGGARESYLICIYEELGMMDLPDEQREIRLIVSMFRLLVLPEAEFISADIQEVYLPNILGLEDRRPSYSAKEVFEGRESERQSILSHLRSGAMEEPGQRLIQWLEAK
jgi:hypothetical protein